MKDRRRNKIAACIASHGEIDGHLGWRLRQQPVQVNAVHAVANVHDRRISSRA